MSDEHTYTLTEDEARALLYATDIGIANGVWPSEWYRNAARAARAKLAGEYQAHEAAARPALSQLEKESQVRRRAAKLEGHELRALRLARGLSLADVARASGYAVGTVRTSECGHAPSSAALAKMRAAIEAAR
jgi:DNA-binding transcriptional regulator YiaG